MEAPNEEKRWDAPLFTVSDPTAPLPLSAIDEVVLRGKVAPANVAVIPARMEGGNYLFELDRVTQDIVKAVVEAQADGSIMVGDAITVPHTKSTVTLARKIHLPELRRIQNQYLKMARLRTPDSIAAIAHTFVDHVNMCIRTQGSAQ